MQTETIEAKIINEFLASKGKIHVPGNIGLCPVFRLAWSEDHLEYRTIHEGKNAGHTILTKKYPFIHDSWMFQQYYSPEMILHEDLPDSRFGDYETLYVFEKNGQKLPLNQKVVELLVYRIMNPVGEQLVKTTIADEMKLDEVEFDKYFDNEMEFSSPTQSLLHSKEAISVPSNLEM